MGYPDRAFPLLDPSTPNPSHSGPNHSPPSLQRCGGLHAIFAVQGHSAHRCGGSQRALHTASHSLPRPPPPFSQFFHSSSITFTACNAAMGSSYLRTHTIPCAPTFPTPSTSLSSHLLPPVAVLCSRPPPHASTGHDSELGGEGRDAACQQASIPPPLLPLPAPTPQSLFFAAGLRPTLAQATISLLFAAGLRPTPAQATIVSWVVKDGMQHASKIAASRLGRSMDADPKRWRVAADVVCDVGAFLECLSPLMPHRFLLLAGLANAGKGLSLVIARATRLPLYDAFAKEGNISDLYAKGEAISVLSSLAGLALGLKLASSVCQTAQAKLAAVPVLAAVHLWSVTEEMRAVPINTLNAQRTNVLINHFLSSGELLSPVDMRWRENIVKPDPPLTLPTAHRPALRRLKTPNPAPLPSPCASEWRATESSGHAVEGEHCEARPATHTACCPPPRPPARSTWHQDQQC
ncbi:unnamed protein product [Closterium sp. Naga37s-1]|nr:unnamed protein product [Closterium sp. Naga37s-1]